MFARLLMNSFIGLSLVLFGCGGGLKTKNTGKDLAVAKKPAEKNPEPKTTAVKPEVKPEPKPEPKPEIKPEPTTDPSPVTPEPAPKPEPAPIKPAPKPEATPIKPAPKPADQSGPCSDIKKTVLKAFVQIEKAAYDIDQANLKNVDMSPGLPVALGDPEYSSARSKVKASMDLRKANLELAKAFRADAGNPKVKVVHEIIFDTKMSVDSCSGTLKAMQDTNARFPNVLSASSGMDGNIFELYKNNYLTRLSNIECSAKVATEEQVRLIQEKQKSECEGLPEKEDDEQGHHYRTKARCESQVTDVAFGDCLETSFIEIKSKSDSIFADFN